MLFALDSKGVPQLAQKLMQATCPICDSAVIPRVGEKRQRHWAHKEMVDCPNSKAMTAWHYNWLKKHCGKNGWEVEYCFEGMRFDCLNQKTDLVLEFQSKLDDVYIRNKIRRVTDAGYSIKWILNNNIMSTLDFMNGAYRGRTYRKLNILRLLNDYLDNEAVRFYVDTHSDSGRGLSSKGLIELNPIGNHHHTGDELDIYKISIANIC